MQKIRLLAVGSLKEKFWKDAVSEYAKRLSRFCDFEIVEVPEASALDGLQKIEKESLLIESKCKGKIVLFDREGKDCSSEGLAAMLKEFETEPVITFVIGGSNGVSEALKTKATKKLRFGSATFPHQLFRVLATEQIYRAFTILAGLPYHK